MVFETKFGLCEVLQMAPKLHTFKNNIYHCVAFSYILKKLFEVLRLALISQSFEAVSTVQWNPSENLQQTKT